ncbi:unnamed protein product [Acanthoscelides obtectus]|uniref:Alpha-methylacyl-CoA racemase n=1 Tax=Acanthoscelides obtectus TaxID=200917 RepID=A0A9P0KWF7_ACAOB|nr:unnamed protein product [Acanthoscelides obtectus]CAK1674940.1 Alpha-methylacyl-CoA racemase [Acanthoscelides obtectus]
MPLKGLKVIEFSGLAPGPFCGMLLRDFGATVIRIDKIGQNVDLDCLGNGKKSICLNLKSPNAVEIVKKLSRQSDVLIEPFRKGVMEKLGLGPTVLLEANPQLIYARLTGYGQEGPLARCAGHDINYIAISGILSLFKRKGEPPLPPTNLAADFGGGGLMCALGILLALLERSKSGLGQVVDNSMVHGSAYLGSWLFRSQNLPIWGNRPGENILDSGAHFYQVYRTKDDKHLAVGALEPQFYADLLKGLGLTEQQAPQFGDFDELKTLFGDIFKQKTREEWEDIFSELDACVTPVLELDEAPKHAHNSLQGTFSETEGKIVPNPAPKLSRTAGRSMGMEKLARRGEHTREVLAELGFSLQEIKKLEDSKSIECYSGSKL